MQCQADACTAEAVIRVSSAQAGVGPAEPLFVCKSCHDAGIIRMLERKDRPERNLKAWTD